MFNPHALIYN